MPLRSSAGDMLGILSVDEPTDGRRPTASSSTCSSASPSTPRSRVEHAQQAAAAERQRAAVDHLLRLTASASPSAARPTRCSTPSAAASGTRSASRRCAWRSMPTLRARSSYTPPSACPTRSSPASASVPLAAVAPLLDPGSGARRRRAPRARRRARPRRPVAARRVVQPPQRPRRRAPGSSTCCSSRCATARASARARCGSTTRRIGCCRRRRRCSPLRVFANHAMSASSPHASSS